ncbi:MAG: hypothetical protein IKN55_13215 [Oscillospiraceae bacterium]|nr:hypothetical protein [Oscillospiraceae bacterium]
MPPRRKQRKSPALLARDKGKIIYPSNRSKGVVSTVIAMLFWIGFCVAIWFISRYQLEHNVYKLLGVVDLMGRDVVYETGKGLIGNVAITTESIGEASREIVNKLSLYRTLILGILELLLMIYPMLEYWLCFRRSTGMRDSYKWYVPVIIMCIISLIAIVIADAIVLALGWMTLLSLAVIFAVIFIPRLTPALQPR